VGRRIEWIGWAALLGFTFIFALPLIFLVSSSLKLPSKIFIQPPEWIPNPITFENYYQATKVIPFFLYMKNTIIISVLATIGTVLSCITPAYALAKMSFRGRRLLFSILLATMFLPYPVVMIPTYLIFAKLHWTGTFLPLIVPSFMGDAFSIFLLRQFFIRLPTELLDAARVDGANELQILGLVVMPLSKAVLATVAVLQFTFMWSDFLRPLLYLNDTHQYTISIGLQNYQAYHTTSWHLVLAGTVIFITPIFLIFWVAQRTFVSGLTLGSLKE